MKKTLTRLLSLLLVAGMVLSVPFAALAVDEVTPPPAQSQPPETPDAPDTQPPQITMEAVLYGKHGTALEIMATVTDDTAVSLVELVYRAAGSEQWQRLPMTCDACNQFTAQIPADQVTADVMEYYVEASDGSNVASREPAKILVDKGISITSLSASKVTAADAANLSITVVGEGFTEEMTVTVGGVEAAYTYVSETEITLTPPVLGVCLADLTIIAGENKCTRLQAITYEDPAAYVRVTASEKVYIGQKVGFPLFVQGSAPIRDVLIQIQLDPARFANVQFALGLSNPDILASCTVSQDGLATIRISSNAPLATAESVGYLTADVLFVEQDQESFLTIEKAAFQDVPVRTFDCPVTISNQIEIEVLHIPDVLYVVEGSKPEINGWEMEIYYDGVKSPLPIPVTEDMIILPEETPGQGLVRYFHKEYPFTYQLLEKENTKLVIKSLPETLNYIVGQELDLKGISLELSYKDGEITIPVEAYSLEGYDPNTQGKQTVTVTYHGLSSSFDVTVFMRGDINMDGKITLIDMVNIKSHVLKTSVLTDLAALAADYNADGKISILDYVQIKAVILGISTSESD